MLTHMTTYKVAIGLLFIITYMFPIIFGESIQYADLIANLRCHNRSVRNLYSPSNEEEALAIIRNARWLNASVSVRGGGIILKMKLLYTIGRCPVIAMNVK